jgi:TPR repeat protein
MGRTFKAAVAALSFVVGFAGAAVAGPYEDALDASFFKGDYGTASRLLRPLAEQGHAAAQTFLGDLYNDGAGVLQDYATAASWYRKAAERGYAEAQFNMGRIYYYGRGVPQDYVIAHMWFNLTAANGDKAWVRDWAVRERDEVAAKMTPAQIAEAQKLAREWKPK